MKNEPDEELTEEIIRTCHKCEKNGRDTIGRYGICPYAKDVEGEIKHCVCCDACSYECLMDI